MPLTEVEISLETDILIVGGGPVGLFTALRFAQLGQRCALIEKGMHTTIHPKMEYSNPRTMEIYRQVGLIEHLKPESVAEHHVFDIIFATGLGKNNFYVTRFDQKSPEALRKVFAESNDGSHPREPYMRQSQVIYERILKDLVQKEPLIEDHWGYSFQYLIETEDIVLSVIKNEHGSLGGTSMIKSQYVIGCDGVGSLVRKSVDIESPRRSLPMKSIYVHFKSKEKEKLQKYGGFWHFIMLNGAFLVAQDEVDTYTLHRMLPPGMDIEIGDPQEFVNEILGGLGGQPFDLKIDEVILTGKWKSDMALAPTFRSMKGRVFLAGDSAHQLSPAGGHGLNSGIHDAFDLTWKLNAVLRGWGGERLLDSYSQERRGVAETNTMCAEKTTTEAIIPWFAKAKELGPENLTATNEEGQRSREELTNVIQPKFWAYAQNGVVMGYNYLGSPIILMETSSPEPNISIERYIPTTLPSFRAPHVFLLDGTSIFDHYGPGFNIVDFTQGGEISDRFVMMAIKSRIPITLLHFPHEMHCRKIWERDVVLVRPDGFVAWRSPPEGAEGMGLSEIGDILAFVTGNTE